jgi:hypothetical protein
MSTPNVFDIAFDVIRMRLLGRAAAKSREVTHPHAKQGPAMNRTARQTFVVLVTALLLAPLAALALAAQPTVLAQSQDWIE